MPPHSHLGRAVAVTLLLLVLTGCHSTTTPEKPDTLPQPVALFPNWPAALNNFRFRWSAEPGIDLAAGAAVPLRAYLESHRIGDYTQNPGDVYPGFDKAVPPGPGSSVERLSTDYQLQYIRPFTSGDTYYRPSGGGIYGNEFFHVLELSKTVNGSYRAYVCDGYYNVFQAQGKDFTLVGGPEKINIAGSFPFIWAWRVELTGQSSEAVQQEGANPAPLGNVFGDWRITGADFLGNWGSPERPDTTQRDYAVSERLTRCGNVMPGYTGQRAIDGGRRDTPPPMEPAEPGWPDNAA